MAEKKPVAKKITPKVRAFIEQYLIDLNATRAYMAVFKCKESSARVMASRLLADTNIALEIQKGKLARSDATGVTAERVLKEIARLAFFDARKLLTGEGEPIPIQDLDDDTAAGIAGLETSTMKIGDGENALKTTVRKYKIADKNSALEKLAKHVGLYEIDNKQKTDALSAILAGMNRSAMPVVKD